jgi:hypothetical protein
MNNFDEIKDHPLTNAFKTVEVGTYAEMFMVKACNIIIGLHGKKNAYVIEDKNDVNGLLQELYIDAIIGKNVELFKDIYDVVKETFIDILQGMYIEDAPAGYPIMQEKMVDNMVDDYILNILLEGKS